MASRVAIIGGYGGMGRIFARLFKEEGFDVTVTGPTERKGRKAAEELGVSYSRDNAGAASTADIVIVTVPISVTVDIIKEVAPHVREKSLLMDLTSIKEGPCKAMLNHSGKGVEVLGCHPIFGPRVGGLENQVLVLTSLRGTKWTQKVRKIFEARHARVYESTPEEHDRIMAVVQGLTHFSYISFAKALKDLNFDIKKSRKFSSPVYELMLDMVGRIIGQDPHLYAEIQFMNPHVGEAHEAFLRSVSELKDIVREKDEKSFVQTMAEAAKNFDDVDSAMGRSDKAISSLAAELKALKESVGREICLCHIYSGKCHLGIVKTVTPESVTLEDMGKESTLKLSNVKVLSEEDRIEFKVQKYGASSRDFSVLLQDNADEKFISKILSEHNPEIIGVTVKDVYRSDKLGRNLKSVCFSVEFINQRRKGKEDSIRDFFSRIGGNIR
ncbi:MAG: prephenate dehydrogenase [Candidatus Altiarchaeota archaeon]